MNIPVQPTPYHTPWLHRPGMVAALIIMATGVARLAFLATGQLDLVQDEAQYWDWSRRLQLSYYSKGPLVAYIIRLFTDIFGDTQFGVRFGAFLGAMAGQVLLYAGMSRLFERPWAGVWALVLASGSPLFLASGVLMTIDNPLGVCWLAALLCLYAAGRGKGGPWPYLGMVAALALGTLAKYMMLAFAPLALAYALILCKREAAPRAFLGRVAVAAVAGSALGLAPIVIWNIQNDFVSFRHVAKLAGVGESQPWLRADRILPFVGSQAGLILPWWLGAIVAGAWSAGRCAWRFGRGQMADASCRGLDGPQALLLALSFWPMMLFFLFWSLHAKILPNWPAVAYLGGAMLGGLWLEGLSQRGGWLAKSQKVWLAMAVATFLLLHFITVLPLPDKLNPALRLMGWQDLSHMLGRLEQSRFEDPRRVFYFADSYDMTAALAFYAPGQPITYSADIGGRRRSQYDLWPGPEDKTGWDAMFVAKDSRGEAPKEFERMFSRIERMEYQTTHQGRPGRRFTLFLCYGFTGYWPRQTQGVHY